MHFKYHGTGEIHENFRRYPREIENYKVGKRYENIGLLSENASPSSNDTQLRIKLFT
jgi:hypothetical protein